MVYLPFGELMAEQSVADFTTPYKFNGKELDTETGMYDFGARYYDPSIGIWMSVDPLADKMPQWSPYNYVFNSPINLTDPTGMSPDCDDCPMKTTGPTAEITATRGPTISQDNTVIAPLAMPSRINEIRGENGDDHWKIKGGATGTEYITTNEMYSSRTYE